jgi:UDPglucose 6-dehydrogenase
MKVCVFGLWHLGTVTAACLASGGHDVTGLDNAAGVVDGLARGTPPLFEPGLEDLVKSGLAAGRLRFASDAATAVRDADVVWVTIDTPVDDDDRADVESVVQGTAALFPHLRDGALMLVSSQLAVGTTRRLEEMFAGTAHGRRVGFAYSPENLRLGKAIEVFTHPDRVVAGVRTERDRTTIAELLRPVTDRIEWMSVESAEMTKHALNAFLATSVAFINEIAAVCEQVGADASEVARGLKSEARIGPKAYLSPGGAFAGGTLARDVMFLSELGRQKDVATHLVSSVKTSNDAHRHWAQRRLSQLLDGVQGKTVAVWGLTYKPGTDTLRRSSAIELCEWLGGQGASVRAHDPAVRQLPAGVAGKIHLAGDPLDAAEQASALVVATPWPEYRSVDARELAGRMAGNVVLDANGFLAATVGRESRLSYLTVGKAIA